MAEEEFGLGGDEHITLPCDSAFMEYISVATEMEEALILSLSASSLTHVSHEHLPISCCWLMEINISSSYFLLLHKYVGIAHQPG
ncbi:hypothetical protein V2J09_000391 [Rumex salicifolius]